MPGPDALPVYGLAAVFAAAALVVWFAGTRLAMAGDELSERYGLAKEFVGLLFLATVTELPEIVTTVTAAQVGNAQLVLGNMFGGITMQTAILAVADIFAVRYALTSWPRKPNHALLAVLLIALLSVLLCVTFLGDLDLGPGIGLGAILLAAGFPLVIYLLRAFDRKTTWAPVDLPDEQERRKTLRAHLRAPDAASNRVLLLRSAVYSLLIVAAGAALAISADLLAERTQLGASFVGVTLLAAATSLPELSTTLAAARIGAYTMAISNIFGSNLIMLALLLPADIAFRGGPILDHATNGAQLSIATGILVTAIYVAGLLIRRTPRILGAGLDSWLVLAVYFSSIAALYRIG
ncbi:sodium:calcium antiporter (plasmid) [Leisingera caerulea]|uniref:Sodium:calcium antiporter n=1 Tax=Leisingera caerulea TaxID=506591 RepID=A0ABY5X3Q5_LEICA|nr:sodium:calcium antiporter [Leisingera caerulea]UWQ61001.1 sodium:calcium antiporter [Leisingera caerulea]